MLSSGHKRIVARIELHNLTALRSGTQNRSCLGRLLYPEAICGRLTNTVGPEELTEQIGRQLGVQIRETVRTDRWDVRPTDDVPTIVLRNGRAESRMLRWALVPAGASTVKTKQPWINAKVETLRSKGSYFGVAPDAAHRALILADGFYEWPKLVEDEGVQKKLKPPPMRFTLDAGRVFCFAGLWATAPHVEDGPLASCTIITCDSSSNRLLAPVHDRMPVILADPELMRAWLDPSISSREALSLCEPIGAQRMSSEIRRVGEQRAPEPLGQLSLT
jgi:putative SOS response-associated peptidase YedK